MQPKVFVSLFVIVFASVIISSSISVFAAPVFTQNTTLVINNGTEYNSQISAVYNNTGNVSWQGNISFQINVTDVNTTGTVTGGIESLIFSLGRPSGTITNFTFNTSNSGQLPSGILFGNVSTNRFFINFTQDQFGGAGAYNYTWTSYNYTTRTYNITTVAFFAVNRSGSGIITILLNGTTAGYVVEKGTGVNITISTNRTTETMTGEMSIITNFTGSNRSIITTNGSFVRYNGTDTSTLTLGNYTVSANISQTENYTAISNNTLFIILRDTTAPGIATIGLSDSIIDAAASITVTASVGDIDSASSTIKLTEPSGDSTTVTYTGGTHTYSGTSVDAVGTYTVLITSTDNSANQATRSTTFEVRSVGGGGSTGGSSGGSSSTTSSGQKETRTVNIAPEQPTTVTMNNEEDHGVLDITIGVNSAANSVQVSVQKLAGKPATVTQDVSGTAYRYLEISKSGLLDTNVKDAKVRFQVEKSWVTENNIDVGSIALNRYSGGAWGELATTLVTSDETTYTFEADTPGFSTFAITGEPVAAEGTAPTTEEAPVAETTATTEAAPTVQLPGGIGTLDTTTAGIIGVVIVVAIGAAFFMMKRGKKGKK